MRLYDRSATVTVEDVEATSSGNTGLHLKFKIKQTLDARHNTADASILGLGDATRGRLMTVVGRMPKYKPPFTVSAGYGDFRATIFKGTAMRIEHKRNSPGWQTDISASDGSVECQRVVNQSFSANTVVGDVISAIARAMGVEGSLAVKQAQAKMFDGNIAKFPNGFVLSGTGRDQMDWIARTLGVEWAILDGQLIIHYPDAASTEEAVLLDRASGMIGAAVLTVDKKKADKTIVKVRSLLHGGLRPGRRMVVNSQDFQCTAKCYEVLHAGDTRGQEYYSDAIGVVL